MITHDLCDTNLWPPGLPVCLRSFPEKFYRTITTLTLLCVWYSSSACNRQLEHLLSKTRKQKQNGDVGWESIIFKLWLCAESLLSQSFQLCQHPRSHWAKPLWFLETELRVWLLWELVLECDWMGLSLSYVLVVTRRLPCPPPSYPDWSLFTELAHKITHLVVSWRGQGKGERPQEERLWGSASALSCVVQPLVLAWAPYP